MWPNNQWTVGPGAMASSVWHAIYHTPSAAFRHLPPHSARTGYATEGALFISAQLFADAVSFFLPSDDA